MVMLVAGMSLFMVFYPTFMFGLAILLVCVLIDALWTTITINNNLGRLHFLGVLVVVMGLVPIGLTRGSLIDFLWKTLSFILIFLGALWALSLLKKAD